MAKIYLAAPYTHPSQTVRQARVDAASRAAALLMQEGHVVFSPLTHGHAVAEFLPHESVASHEFWMRQCLPMLKACDWLVIVPMEGWSSSRGVAEEQAFALLQGMPVFFWESVHREGTLLQDDDESELCALHASTSQKETSK